MSTTSLPTDLPSDLPTPLPSGAIIGIFGGGQLGRMLAQSATKLGYRTHVYDSLADTPASRVSDFETVAPYEDLKAIITFAKSCDVVTYEFENIPIAAVKEAQKHVSVYPDAKALETSHDRLIEKTFLRDTATVPVAKFHAVETMSALTNALTDFGGPSVLKTRRFGYDGKGQVKISDEKDVKGGFARLGGADLIAEDFVPFVREFSIIAARAQDGTIASYPMTENVHKDHRLHTSIAPANDPQNVKENAHAIAERILDALSYIGVMGIEFFELENGKLIVNEIAPRVHNSGHWTQNAGCTDQFEQHIRAITGLPLGDTVPIQTVLMTNLIGEEIKNIKTIAQRPDTFVHDYDKHDIRAGRKMGHVNEILGKF
ncbi:MAG: 5-(carboxyamino)imidazole ribonucleotide synthase [Robiginitomaculum sp.]|nr:MAG: 5-(carboxyamino)imidazole ribonucleotide synthase [Robiginitomaculum sp.]